MANLVRREPFQEMMQLQKNLDQLFAQWFNWPTMWSNGSSWPSGSGSNSSWSNTGEYPLALDVAENEDEYIINAELPGIDTNDLEITLTNNVLTIRGEVKPEPGFENAHSRLRERLYGRFVRSLTLPTTVQSDQIQANYEKGILVIHVPKAEQAKPKRIAVKTPQLIEG